MNPEAVQGKSALKIFTVTVLLLLLAFHVISFGSFPSIVHGRVFDNATNYCRLGVVVNVTGNTSGFIWSGTSYAVPESGFQQGCGVIYSNNESENISWVVGELVTASSANTGQTGYAGNASDIASDPIDISIELNLSDVAPPRHYNVTISSGLVRRGMSVVVESYWMDNSGVLSLALQHNGSGQQVNYSVFSNENVSSTKSVHDAGKNYTVIINSTNFTRGTKVSWNLVGWDPPGNVNDSFPLQSFTVQNALPVMESVMLLPTFPYANMSLNCSASASDLDGDNVTLYYGWLVQGLSLNVTGSGLGVGNYTQGDNVTCMVTPFDGLEFGSVGNGTVVIQSYGQIKFNEGLSPGWNLISLPVEIT